MLFRMMVVMARKAFKTQLAMYHEYKSSYYLANSASGQDESNPAL